MDLLATVRKEGSRGGRGDFQWSDVQGSSHRENYLGHSLMAPVGRWQKGRDLNWYAKAAADTADGDDPQEQAARLRREEIRKVKEAEEDALARALGLPVPERNNPNTVELGDRKKAHEIIQASADNDTTTAAKGVGFGSVRNTSTEEGSSERIEGTAEQQDKELQYALKEYKRRHGDKEHRNRSRSRSPRRERKHHQHHDRHDRHRTHGKRPRSHSRDIHRRRRSRSRDRPDTRRQERNRSPLRRHHEHTRDRRP